MSAWDWLWHGHTDWQWWQAVLYVACWCAMGSLIGYLLAKAHRRRKPFNTRYVRPRCLQLGHKWQRIECMPIQFCRRYSCMGVRVAPFMIGNYPDDLVSELEQSLDENGALSLDRRP